MASFGASLIQWTDEIGLQLFVYKYENRLPQMVRTTCGYSDIDNINDIAADEVSEVAF
jgi:hypothetical protein